MLHDVVQLAARRCFISHPYSHVLIGNSVAHEGDRSHDVHAAAGFNKNRPASLLRQSLAASHDAVTRKLCSYEVHDVDDEQITARMYPSGGLV